MWQGERIELHEVRREYLPRYVEWLNDWEIEQYLTPGIPVPHTLEDEIEWYESRSKDKGSNIIFAILAQPERNLIGNCGLHKLDWKNRSAVFGIFIGDRNYWNKGYGTDAMRVMLGYGFMELNLVRIQLNAFSYNERAIKSYLKAGFVEEGRQRGMLLRDGRRWDFVYMSVLRSEWLA